MGQDKRIRIIVGHYGSGKTEFAVNYAIKLAKEKKKVALVDLDIVNLYFRSREKKDMLESLGIKVIGSNLEGRAADVPAISPSVLLPLQDKSYEAILDVGGDDIGARTLGRYHSYFQKEDYDMFCVVNANRPETQDVYGVIKHIQAIQNISRLSVTGLINNTHLLRETTTQDVLKGQQLIWQVSERLHIPIKYVSVLAEVAEKLPQGLEGEIFPIRLYMREDWMDRS
ncbi:MAG TPA: MinD/ParA family protein [Clostridiales bacterium]|nr:MinD/ParA family protein [Clostridiales bacterium]